MLLVGDIGGTKTDLAIIAPDARAWAPLAQEEFRSADYASLDAIVHEFLLKVKMPVERACFAVAGPVLEGRAKITNLPWTVEAEALRQKFALQTIYLLNDLEAMAMAVPSLAADDLIPINVGVPMEHGAIAVIAPGTGLGEAFLIWDGSRYIAQPSEGEHGNFAPSNEAEIGLLKFLLRQHHHVSVERVCSGSGLPNIYDYLRESGAAPEPPDLARQLAAAADRTPIIAQAAENKDEPCELCVLTIDMFIKILGAEAGNLVLRVLATGGVYIGGGIPGRMVGALQDGRFMAAFSNKGRFREMLARTPVHIIKGPAVLLGAARCVLGLV